MLQNVRRKPWRWTVFSPHLAAHPSEGSWRKDLQWQLGQRESQKDRGKPLYCWCSEALFSLLLSTPSLPTFLLPGLRSSSSKKTSIRQNGVPTPAQIVTIQEACPCIQRENSECIRQAGLYSLSRLVYKTTVSSVALWSKQLWSVLESYLQCQKCF